MPRDSFKRARRFGWLHLAVGITMGLEELKSRERGLWHYRGLKAALIRCKLGLIAHRSEVT